MAELNLHVTQLEKTRDQEKSYIDLLEQENSTLKGQNAGLLNDKEEL